MNEGWYCKIVGMEMGPMSFDDLVQLAVRGNLRHDHPVRHGTQGAWVSAGTVEGLFSDHDSSTAAADFDMDPFEVVADGAHATGGRSQTAVESESQIRTPARPQSPTPAPSHRAPERQTTTAPMAAEPVASTAETKRVEAEKPAKPPKAAKPPKPAKASKPAKRKTIAKQGRSATSRAFRFNGKLIMAAACLAGVSLGVWALLGWQGQRKSRQLTDHELVAACHDLHKVLNSSRGTSLTTQSLGRFEMQFLRQISAVRSHVSEAPAGSSRAKIAAALTELGQMPRCAVSSSESSAYEEHERKFDELIAQAAGGAGN